MNLTPCKTPPVSKPKASPGTTRAEVRTGLERGRSIREIALVLGLSTQTVYWHAKKLAEPDKAR